MKVLNPLKGENKKELELNNPSRLCFSLENMISFYNDINRDKLEYDIDGIVYKVNSYKQQKYHIFEYDPPFNKYHPTDVKHTSSLSILLNDISSSDKIFF